MKIKILQDIPASEDRKPAIGGIYDVMEDDGREGPNRAYIIEVNGNRVGVLARECVEVGE